jgi:hypothetical protein
MSQVYRFCESLLWARRRQWSTAEALVCRGGHFRPNNTYTSKHHYLATSATVAKLVATSGKGQEAEPIYKALNQSLNALVAMRGRSVSIPEAKKRGSIPRFVMEYPVVVGSSFDQMFSVDFFSEPTPEQIVENFQLEVRYAYVDSVGGQCEDDFLLDFVEFAQIDAFTTAIAEDANVAALFAGS